jgi:transposase
VIAERLSGAVHVLGRFLIMQEFGEAPDEIRAEEAKRLRRDGHEPDLKRSRWCFLKRPADLTDKRPVKLSEVLKYDLRTVRAHLLREEFPRVWESRGAWCAGILPDEWTRRVMRSRPEPMKRIARTIRVHRPLIRNRFRAREEVSSGAVEGLNNKVKLYTGASDEDRKLCSLYLSIMDRMGVKPDRFGDAETRLAGL